jgi:hypothetical protein
MGGNPTERARANLKLLRLFRVLGRGHLAIYRRDFRPVSPQSLFAIKTVSISTRTFRTSVFFMTPNLSCSQRQLPPHTKTRHSGQCKAMRPTQSDRAPELTNASIVVSAPSSNVLVHSFMRITTVPPIGLGRRRLRTPLLCAPRSLTRGLQKCSEYASSPCNCVSSPASSTLAATLTAVIRSINQSTP